MLITGTILQISPPDFTDNYGNHHQNITIQTQNGPVIGRKGSKTPYAVQDLNKQVSWECEQKTNSRGAYNKFTMPQDPKYAQTAPQQPQQAAQQAVQQPNVPQGEDKAVGMVRHGVVCAYISASVDPDIQTCNYWTQYIMTGQAPLPPAKPSEEIPY